MAQAHKKLRVEQVINELGLTKCGNTLIGTAGTAGSISGGERKRLALASEILANPSLIICDEPTSGLDSFMAKSVVSVLKEMTARGKIVISTFHQPSSEIFQMFDRLMLMAVGRVAYFGNQDGAMEFFKMEGFTCLKNYNPSDFYIRTLAVATDSGLSEKRVDIICDHFESSVEGQALIASNEDNWNLEENNIVPSETKKNNRASFWIQFVTLFRRATLGTFRNKSWLRMRLAGTMITALILGAVFSGQSLNQQGVMGINGCLFYILMTSSSKNSGSSLPMFQTDRSIFYREYHSGMYGFIVYYITKAFAEILKDLILTIVYPIFPYWMAGLNPDPTRFIYACFIIAIASQISSAFGYLMSISCPTLPVAMTISTSLRGALKIVAGFYINIKSLPSLFYWIQAFSWLRYAFEALLINQWDGINYIECNASLDLVCHKNGLDVINAYGYEKDNFNRNVAILLGQLMVYHVIAIVVLAFKVKPRG